MDDYQRQQRRRELAIPEELRKAALSDPVIHRCLSLHVRGDITVTSAGSIVDGKRAVETRREKNHYLSTSVWRANTTMLVERPSGQPPHP